MRFYERFRAALARFSDGVHQLDPPASERAVDEAERRLGRALPAEFRDFLRQWNGGWLFHDDYALFGVGGAGAGELELAGDRVRIGEGVGGALLLDERGRVIAVDAETETERVEGSRFERWLDATIAREALVYDREGEFRDEAFDGGELSAKLRRKRAQAAAKADPDAPAWREELAAILVEEGRPAQAIAELERAVELEPASAPAWFALGKLHRDAGDAGRAAACFERAGESERDPQEASFALAHAVRAAVEAPEAERPDVSAIRERVRRLDASFVDQQRAAARHLLDEGELGQALERLSLALAIDPDDAELGRLVATTRARQSLRIVD
jgi:tetratricopeptide (TPR) repeat protein